MKSLANQFETLTSLLAINSTKFTESGVNFFLA